MGRVKGAARESVINNVAENVSQKFPFRRGAGGKREETLRALS